MARSAAKPITVGGRSVSAMDEIALASKMKRFAIWLDRRCRPDGFVQRQFEGPPFGHAYVTIDPDRQGPFASFNLNRVYLCGTEAGLEPEGLARLIGLFTGAGVHKFFVWLSPGPDMDVARRWLEEREQGFFHYMAFDGRRPVAVAVLCVFEDLGYLWAASTAESDRRRGAQQALIARRIAKAEEIGCTAIVSETLYLLQQSYRNLQWAGFREAYEKEVYVWGA